MFVPGARRRVSRHILWKDSMSDIEKVDKSCLDLGNSGGKGVVILPDQAGRIHVLYEPHLQFPPAPSEPPGLKPMRSRIITYPKSDAISPENWRRQSADVSKLISQAIKSAGRLGATQDHLRAMLYNLDSVQTHDQLKMLLTHWQGQRLDLCLRDLRDQEDSPQEVSYVKLRVNLDHKSNRLSFHLDAERTQPRYVDYDAGFRDLKRSPEEYISNVLKRLGDLVAEKTHYDDTEIVHQLSTEGRTLFEAIFSPCLKREYSRFCGSVRTLWIISDESWIPWELIRPFPGREAPQLEQKGFLCEVFHLVHWMPGERPQPVARIGPSCCLILGEESLDVESEQQCIEKFVKDHGMDSVDKPRTRKEVLELLSTKSFDLIHIACGCKFDESDPGRSWLKLGDKSPLRPSDLTDPSIRNNIQRSHPFVFINGCHAGRTGWGLADREGWAATFIEAGCSVLIAPMWKVEDQLAVKFATELYSRLTEGEHVAHAVWLARMKVKDLAAGNPSWLAYRVYADPNCYVTFQDQMV
jgi:hypothetical protein